MRRPVLTVMAALLLTQTACYGHFRLTTKLWQFNRGVSTNKFVQELVFLGLIIIPAYELAALGDMLIFNTIEFWGGQNPVSADAGGGELPPERLVQLPDGSTLRLAWISEGVMEIEHDGEVQVVRRTEDGLALFDATGIEKARATSFGDGALIEKAGDSRFYAASELEAAGADPVAIASWAGVQREPLCLASR